MQDRIRDLQHALVREGLDPGPCDGIWGRRSIAALRIFQAAHGLMADGVAGPKSLGLLGPDATPAFVWLEEARRLMGLCETPGPSSTPSILDWAGALGIAYSGDDRPWCGLFLAHCIAATLPQEPLPANPLAARSWAKWGDATSPGVGAVLIFWRGTKASWQGHVGLYVGEDSIAYHVLGGNQGDAVSIARIGRDRLLAARWPTTAPHGPRTVHITPKTGLSKSEA